MLRPVSLHDDVRGIAFACAGHGTYTVSDSEIGQRGDRPNSHLPAGRVGIQLKVEGLEIDHQGVGQRVVQAQSITVECRGIGFVCGEMAVIDEQTAADIADALASDFTEELPEVLQHEIRIAIAFNEQITLEYSVFDRPQGVDAGIPCMRRTEQVQCGPGSDQLDG